MIIQQVLIFISAIKISHQRRKFFRIKLLFGCLTPSGDWDEPVIIKED